MEDNAPAGRYRWWPIVAGLALALLPIAMLAFFVLALPGAGPAGGCGGG